MTAPTRALRRTGWILPSSRKWGFPSTSTLCYGNINAYMTCGTERTDAYKILEETLNLRDIRIYDTKQNADGKERRVFNSKETTMAQQTQ
jgi:hypothetical protein